MYCLPCSPLPSDLAEKLRSLIIIHGPLPQKPRPHLAPQTSLGGMSTSVSKHGYIQSRCGLYVLVSTCYECNFLLSIVFFMLKNCS